MYDTSIMWGYGSKHLSSGITMICTEQKAHEYYQYFCYTHTKAITDKSENTIK